MNTEVIERQLQQIVSDVDARRIAAAMAVALYTAEFRREAFVLCSAQTTLDDQQLVIQTSSREDTFLVRGRYQVLASVARQFELQRVVLTWRGANHDGFAIWCQMQTGSDNSIFDEPPPLQVSAPVVEAMRLADLIRSSENPIGAVCLDSDWQFWGNQALSVMCQKPLDELVRMNVRSNWVNRRTRTDDGLAEIKRRLVSEGDFELAYTTKMSGDATAKHNFYSRFRAVLGGSVRLTEIYAYEPVR